MDILKVTLFILMALFLIGVIGFIAMSDRFIDTGKKNKKGEK